MQVSILALHVHRLLIALNCALRLAATQAEPPLCEQEKNAYGKLDSIDDRRPTETKRGNQFTFRITLEIPVDDFLRHHYVDAVVRETRKKEVEDQKPHVADTAPHTLFR
jgi:hypothetical protein